MWSTVFGRGRSAPRDRYSRALDARGLNPLPKEAQGGRKDCVPSGPRGRFQPTPAALVEPLAAGFRPDVSGNPSGSVAKAARRPRPALPARSPPPLVRSPAERPPPRRGEEQYGRGFRGDASISDALVGQRDKALISRRSGGRIPAPGRALGLPGGRRTKATACFRPVADCLSARYRCSAHSNDSVSGILSADEAHSIPCPRNRRWVRSMLLRHGRTTLQSRVDAHRGRSVEGFRCRRFWPQMFYTSAKLSPSCGGLRLKRSCHAYGP